MRSSFVKKIVSITLAAAMVLGEAGTALAGTTSYYTGNAANSQSLVATASDGASLASTTKSISDLSLTGQTDMWDGDIEVSANVQGYRWELKVNDVLADSGYTGSDEGYNYIYKRIDVRLGASYTVKLIVYDSDGASTEQTKAYTAISTSIDSVTASSLFKTNSSGYRKYSGVKLQMMLKDGSSYSNYEIYRSTKASSGYKKIGECWDYCYTDDTAVAGNTYYYKVYLVTGTDTYIKTSKVLSKSPACKIKAGAFTEKPSVTLSYTSAGVEININDTEYANQFDVYRSTKKNSGYKKIKTLYGTTGVDKTVKSGKTYYYKVVPKCYYKDTKKVVKGKTSDVVGVATILGEMSVTVKQVSATSLKLSWEKVAGANAYEVWISDDNISGDPYKKVATTKKLSTVVKGLSSKGSYSIKVYAQKKSGSVVKYQASSSAWKTMGYTTYLSNVEVVSTSSKLSSDKGTLVTNSKITWDVDWGASGYIITAYNNYTGKTETIKKIKSAKTHSYVFKNTTTAKNGTKYGYVYVTPYKGSKKGQDSWVDIASLAKAKSVRVTKKDASTAKVTWSKVAGATSYEVYRRSSYDSYDEWIGTANTNYYLDTDISTGVTYTYVVYASAVISKDGSSSYVGGSASDSSNEYSHSVGTPAITKIANSSSKSATISWKSIPNADSYIIYRATSKKGVYKKVGTVKSTKLSFVNKKLTKGKTYYYKVVASSTGDNGSVTLSKASTAKSVKIKK
jgi:fibronectin type 3 domain-containing protein